MKDFSKSCVKSTLSVATALSVFFAGSYPKDNQMLVSAACVYPSENQIINSSECYAGIIKAIQQIKTEEPESKMEAEAEIETEETINNTKEENKNKKKKESKSKSKNQKKSIKETIIEKKIEPITMYSTTAVNFRENPSLEANVIKTISRNTQVTKIADCGNWSKVKLTNNEKKYGYIYTNYLSDTKQPNRWNITLTADEITLLEKIVWREAGNQSLIGQEAVAEVVLNRMASKDFPNTLYEVLSQKGQFVSWAVRNVGTPTESVKKAVKEVLDGNTYILSNEYLYFSRGGHANHGGMVKIGDHQFCPRT